MRDQKCSFDLKCSPEFTVVAAERKKYKKGINDLTSFFIPEVSCLSLPRIHSNHGSAIANISDCHLPITGKLRNIRVVLNALQVIFSGIHNISQDVGIENVVWRR